MITKLGRLLEEITGMAPSVLGDRILERALRERMSACKLADGTQYLQRVRLSPQETEALIDAVVVPETSFFRNSGPFAFLCGYIRSEWLPARSSEPLRVLSAPCSSGEEPYSVAMMLQEADLEPEEYTIDALDISRALLRKAERAVYTPHSFRGVPDSLRDRYFVPAESEFLLKDKVRRGVRFIHGNLLDEKVLADEKPYDIVFFRNLLIYFGAEARSRVLKTVERLTVRNGLLFVGHAETACFRATKFVPLEHRGVFGFRKGEASAAKMEAGQEKLPPAVVSSPLPVDGTPKAPGDAKRLPARAARPSKPIDSFEAARQMGDQGRLSDAAAMCERLLLDDGTNAGIYCLLGTILHGLGNLGRAEECFTRAIFLDEQCYDAVVHLSLIKEHRGDVAGAEVLRQRAARIHRKTRIL
jgi:chemotaxis protein methyltransferase WspC